MLVEKGKAKMLLMKNNSHAPVVFQNTEARIVLFLRVWFYVIDNAK